MAKYQLKTPKFAEKHVVDAYQKIRDGVVGCYQKIEDRFVDTFLEPAEEQEPPTEGN